MVQQSVPTTVEKTFLPRRAQPWEVASMLIGVPGAMASAVATSALAMYAANGDALLAACAGVAVVGGYLATMAVILVGVASERP